MQRTYTPLLRRFGLTYLQYLVLLVLWEADNQFVGEIGRRLFLDSGTLTPVLRRLEALRYVSRQRSTDDERTVSVRLTPGGIALESEMDALRERITSKAALDAQTFSELREELRTLRTSLTAASHLSA